VAQPKFTKREKRLQHGITLAQPKFTKRSFVPRRNCNGLADPEEEAARRSSAMPSKRKMRSKANLIAGPAKS